MRIISLKRVREFAADHPPAKRPLAAWAKATAAATWHSFAELKQTFGSADAVGNCVVVDVGGNKYRLAGRVLYARAGTPLPGVVYVLRIMTHADYDRDPWADDCGCYKPPPKRKPTANGRPRP